MSEVFKVMNHVIYVLFICDMECWLSLRSLLVNGDAIMANL